MSLAFCPAPFSLLDGCVQFSSLPSWVETHGLEGVGEEWSMKKYWEKTKEAQGNFESLGKSLDLPEFHDDALSVHL